VNYQFPEGDQFLFVKSDGEKILVEFIDPDAPVEEQIREIEAHVEDEDRTEAVTVDKKQITLKNIVCGGHGNREEYSLLGSFYDELKKEIQSSEWENRKLNLFEKTTVNDFWESNDRFGVLGDIEYIDRIETAFQSTTSLLQRIKNIQKGQRTLLPVSLIMNLGQKIYLLQEALLCLENQIPKDCFLLVETRNKGTETAEATLFFAQRICMMYKRWTKKRHMRSILIQEKEEKSEGYYRSIFAVSGFGAYSILKLETGLHIYEFPKDSRSFTRCTVLVRVVPQPKEPVAKAQELLKQAEEYLNAPDSTAQKVVRRYREKPSPLIRDSVRGWRSGKVNIVFDGDFDVMA
jgi:ATP-dependent Clp protease ATP-binding subunit ClpC